MPKCRAGSRGPSAIADSNPFIARSPGGSGGPQVRWKYLITQQPVWLCWNTQPGGPTGLGQKQTQGESRKNGLVTRESAGCTSKGTRLPGGRTDEGERPLGQHGVRITRGSRENSRSESVGVGAYTAGSGAHRDGAGKAHKARTPPRGFVLWAPGETAEQLQVKERQDCYGRGWAKRSQK